MAMDDATRAVVESVIREARERHLNTQTGAGEPYSEYTRRLGIYEGMKTLLNLVDPEFSHQLEQAFVSEGYL